MERPARLFLEVKQLRRRLFIYRGNLNSPLCGFVVCLGRNPEGMNGMGKSGYESRGLNFAKLSLLVLKLSNK